MKHADLLKNTATYHAKIKTKPMLHYCLGKLTNQSNHEQHTNT